MCASLLIAAVSLSGIFSSKVVLQRGREVPVWGYADAGETVTVTFAGQTKVAMADGSGDWEVRLAPMEASTEGRTLTVSGASSSRTLTDVLVGDVWMVTG